MPPYFILFYFIYFFIAKQNLIAFNALLKKSLQYFLSFL